MLWFESKATHSLSLANIELGYFVPNYFKKKNVTKRKMSVLVYLCCCTGFLLKNYEKIVLEILWISECFVTQ